MQDEDSSGASLPDYVKKQPWYFQTGDDQIGHQRLAPYAAQKKTDLSEFQHRGHTKKEAVKWRPGCCKNCGSSTHTEFECTERPRKKNARVTGIGIATRDSQEKHDLSWDAKHDQFAGYSASRWRMEVSGQFRHADRVRATAPDTSRSIEIREEYGHTNFRNREDTASYLKSVGRDNENDSGEMWVKRVTGEAEIQTNEDETIEQRRKMRDFIERKELMTRTEVSDGFVKEVVPKSKYGALEDVYVNGHTAVFGSYFSDGKWGYACCRQLGKDCYCTNPA